MRGQIIGVLILSLVLGVMFGGVLTKSHTEDKDFAIYSSYSVSSPNSRETTLRVIVEDSDCDKDEMFSKIKEFHESMNGRASTLIIHLYSSKLSLENNICLDTKTFKSQQNSSKY